jgi:hypothetical protein
MPEGNVETEAIDDGPACIAGSERSKKTQAIGAFDE